MTRLSDVMTDRLMFSPLESFHNMANTQDSAQTRKPGSPYLKDDGTVHKIMAKLECGFGKKQNFPFLFLRYSAVHSTR